MLLFDLQFFADGAAAPAAAPATADAGTQDGQTIKYDVKNVVYGKQDARADVTRSAIDAESAADTTSDTMEAKKKAFNDLIQGEYKDLFTERVNGIVNRRFKDVKGVEDKLAATSPILQILGEKYKIEDGDPEKIRKAIEADDAYWEEAAEAAGQTVEQYKYVKQLERQNAEIMARETERREAEERQRFLDTTFQKWTEQETEAKQYYPEMTLKAELQNPQFAAMLKAGVPVKAAYEVVHINDVKASVAKSTANRVERNVTANIRSRGQRPPENGASGGAAVTIKPDVHGWNKKDRAEIARRVARGERIVP